MVQATQLIESSETARKTRITWGLTALLIVSTGSMAQDQSGWAKFGSALAGGGSVDRDRAYAEGLQQGLQVQDRRYIEQARAQLSQVWMKFGFSTTDARAIAAAYEESASEPAVFAGARRKGIQSAGPDIRKALDDNNYLLANQLVLAYAVVSGEQQKVAHEEAERRSAATQADAAREDIKRIQGQQ